MRLATRGGQANHRRSSPIYVDQILMNSLTAGADVHPSLSSSTPVIAQITHDGRRGVEACSHGRVSDSLLAAAALVNERASLAVAIALPWRRRSEREVTRINVPPHQQQQHGHDRYGDDSHSHCPHRRHSPPSCGAVPQFVSKRSSTVHYNNHRLTLGDQHLFGARNFTRLRRTP
jgi:hypothetical protein